MAPVITELLEGRSTDTNAQTAIRQFRVTDPGVGVTEPVGRQVAIDSGLVRGQPHPDPTVPLALRGIRVNQDGATVYVTADYTLPELTVPQYPVDPLNPNFQSMRMTYRREEIVLPAFRRRKTADETGAMVELWAADEQDRRVTKREHVYTYRLSGSFTQSLTASQWLAQLDVIDEQTDLLHLFNGNYYRFEPAIINQESLSDGVDPARFRIEYNWVRDKGIRVRDPNQLSVGAEGPGGVNGNLNLRKYYSSFPIGPGSYFPVEDPGNRVVLGPFRRVDTESHPDGAQFPPLTVFSDNYEKNDFGYLTLPGVV